MKVNVVFFSDLRLKVGKRNIELEIKEGLTVKELLEVLYDRFGDDVRHKIVDTNTKKYKMHFKVNDILSVENIENIVLKEGDTLTIIPPIAGG